jgi:hypothetical protein
MSDPLMEALFIGAGAFIGSKLGHKYLGPEGEKPMWNGHINNDPRMPAVIIGQVFHHGKTSYRLYIAADGDWAMVGESAVYAEILALLQSWERFISEGGTLNAWRCATRRAIRRWRGGRARCRQISPAAHRRAIATPGRRTSGVNSSATRTEPWTRREDQRAEAGGCSAALAGGSATAGGRRATAAGAAGYDAREGGGGVRRVGGHCAGHRHRRQWPAPAAHCTATADLPPATALHVSKPPVPTTTGPMTG